MAAIGCTTSKDLRATLRLDTCLLCATSLSHGVCILAPCLGLEPPGYGVYRKSAVDSLALGCIPVTFAHLIDPVKGRLYEPMIMETRVFNEQMFPHHWSASWRKDSEVQLDMVQVLKDEVDLAQVLRALPPERARQMQQAIAVHAQAVHYAFDDVAGVGDALEISLNLVAASADAQDAART